MDIEVLDRVLLRFAYSEEEEQLTLNVNKFLIPVLEKLKSTHDETRKKVIEVLSHILKRVKPLNHFKLPLTQLLQFYNDIPATTSPTSLFPLNFSIIYLELAFQRASEAERKESFPHLIQTIVSRPQNHQYKILNLWIKALSEMKNRDYEQDRDIQSVISKPEIKNLLLDFFLDILISTPRDYDTSVQEVGPGLSKFSLSRLQCLTPLSNQKLIEIKEGIIKLLKCDSLFTFSEKLIHFIIGSVDYHHTISSSCEDFLKRQGKIDLENKSLIQTLYQSFLGSPNNNNNNNNNNDDDKKRTAVSSTVRIKIITYLCKSTTAANMYPYFLQLIFESIYGENTTSKLTHSGMGFIQWVFKQASSEVLNITTGKIILGGLIKYMNILDSLIVNDSSLITLRSYTISSIGLLGKRIPELFSHDYSLLQRLFNAVSSGDSNSKVSAQEALLLLVSSFYNPNTSNTQILLKLLKSNIESKEYQARYAAVYYSNRIFPFDHAPSRYFNIILSNDSKIEVKDEAKKGLQPYRRDGNSILSYTSRTPTELEELRKIPYPSFSLLIQFIFQQLCEKNEKLSSSLNSSSSTETDSSSSSSEEFLSKPSHFLMSSPNTMDSNLLLFPVDIFLQILQFLSLCLKENARHSNISISDYLSKQSIQTLDIYLLIIEAALAKNSVAEVQEKGSGSLLELLFHNPKLFIPRYKNEISILMRLLKSSRIETRENMARVITLLSSTSTSTNSGSEFETEQVKSTLFPPVLIKFLDEFLEFLSKTGVRDLINVEEVHGNMTLVSCLISKYLRDKQEKDRKKKNSNNSNSETMDLEIVHDKNDVQLNKYIEKYLTMYNKWLSCSSNVIIGASIDGIGLIGRYIPLPIQNDISSTSKDHPSSSSSSTDTANTALPTVKELIDKLVELFNSPDRTIVEKVVKCFGNLSLGSRDVDLHNLLISHIFALTKYRQEEVHISVGETLSFIVQGTSSKAIKDPLVPLEFQQISQEEKEREGEEIVKQDNELISNMIDKILKEVVISSQNHVRMAGSIWLMSLVQFCYNNPLIQNYFEAFQSSFQLLLADIEEVTQEISSRGLVLIYNHSPEDIRKKLVDSLVQTLSVGTKGLKKTKDDELFKQGTLGKTLEGSEMSTYRELASVASDLGQPDLLFKFLQLSSYQSLWNSRRGAANATTSILQQSRDQLTPYLPSLVPVLYRYSYDPNPKIAHSMGNILSSIMNTKKAVDQYFTLVMKDLLSGLSSNQWRVRESCCMATADILQGRTFGEVIEYLPEIYKKSFERMDDIKETVRIAGKVCCRSVCSLSLRLCNNEYTNQQNAEKVLDIYLNFLLNDGLVSNAEEVRKFSMGQLLKVAQIAGPILSKHAPQMISILLEGLSAFEPRSLNYLTFHTESLNITEQQLEDARIELSKYSPLNDSIELALKHINNENVSELLSKLMSLMKSSLSIPTRVGTGRIIITLTNEHGPVIKPHLSKLIRMILNSGLNDLSGSVKRNYATVLGYLCRIMNSKQLIFTFQSLISHYFNKYEEGSSSSSSPSSRMTVVETFREIVKLNTRTDNSSLTSELKELTPILFFFKNDPDENVKKMFCEILDELGITKYTIRLYIKEILYILSTLLTSSSAESLSTQLKIENEYLLKLTKTDSPSWSLKKQVALSLLTLLYTLYPSPPYSEISNTDLSWISHLSTVSSVYSSILTSLSGSSFSASSSVSSQGSVTASEDHLSQYSVLIYENILFPELYGSQRVWSGKEVFVLAVGEVARLCKSYFSLQPSTPTSTSTSSNLNINKLYQLVIHESQKTNIEYKKHSLLSLSLLLHHYPDSSTSVLSEIKPSLYPLAFHKEILQPTDSNNSPSSPSSSPSESDENSDKKRDEGIRLVSLLVLSLVCVNRMENKEKSNLEEVYELLSLFRKQITLSSWKMKLEILVGMNRMTRCLLSTKVDQITQKKVSEVLMDVIFETAREKKFAPVKKAAIDLLHSILKPLKVERKVLSEYQNRILNLINEVRDDQNSSQLDSIKIILDNNNNIIIKNDNDNDNDNDTQQPKRLKQ